MSVFKMKASTEFSGEITPAGTHAAVMVALIDVGTHRRQFKDKPAKWVREIILVWDLPEEKKAIGASYALSLAPKSSLRGLIRQWRGKDLGDNEEFDLLKLVGQPCILSVVHKTSGNQKTYANVAGASQLPKGMPKPTPRFEPFAWEIGQGDPPDFEWLPWVMGTKVVDHIKVSQEWEKAHGRQPGAQAAPRGDAADDDVPEPQYAGQTGYTDDDIPF